MSFERERYTYWMLVYRYMFTNDRAVLHVARVTAAPGGELNRVRRVRIGDRRIRNGPETLVKPDSVALPWRSSEAHARSDVRAALHAKQRRLHGELVMVENQLASLPREDTKTTTQRRLTLRET